MNKYEVFIKSSGKDKSSQSINPNIMAKTIEQAIAKGIIRFYEIFPNKEENNKKLTISATLYEIGKSTLS